MDRIEQLDYRYNFLEQSDAAVFVESFVFIAVVGVVADGIRTTTSGTYLQALE